jgi:DNA repair protein RecO (recombination protein O)
VDSSLYTLQFIISTPIEKVFSFVVSDKVLERLMRISREFLNRHLQGEFKSLEMLNVLES